MSSPELFEITNVGERPFFTWRGQRQAREAQEENQQNTQAQLRHAQEELSLTRQGQITERFTRAIDQLGNESQEIRLGGIYALERIARESEEDHWPIMEVLTAYVRQHAPWLAEEACGDERDESEPAEPPIPGPDIEAIITVLRRRKHYLGGVEPEPIDLHETFLWGADFRRADLVAANFSGANLWNANFFKANLSAAYLSEAILLRADFSEADLSGANLSRAYLSGANLSRAYLSGANLSNTDVFERNVPTNLSGANLSGANLSEAIISQAQLEETAGDENTVLPSGLKPPAHWGVKTDKQSEAD